jgi:hypothetical protein
MDPFQAPAPSQSFRITPQLVIGLLVVFVGVVFTLDELGIAPATSYLRYWPSAIIAVGVAKLLQARDGNGAFGGLLLTILGIWLQGEELDLLHINLRQVWPIGLVLFGVYLVWQGLTKRPPAPPPPPISPFDPLPPIDSSLGAGSWNSPPIEPFVEQPAPERKPAADASASEERKSCGARGRNKWPRTHDNQPRMHVVAIMSGISRGSSSTAFRGADLVAVMGGCEIDLRKAAINGEATIDLFCMWGGIEIRVPEDWVVESQVVPLMGGVDDKTRPPQSATAHHLKLRGVALMGGIEIKN